MLFVADVHTKKILFRVDAWQSDCMDLARKFLRNEQLYCIKEEVTPMGDMIIWVEEG